MRVEDLRVDENVFIVLSSIWCVWFIFGPSSNPHSPNFFLYTHHQRIYCIIRRFSPHHAIHYKWMHSLFFPLLNSTTLVCDCDGDDSWHQHWVQCVSVWQCECLWVYVHMCVCISLWHTHLHTHTHALSLSSIRPSIPLSVVSPHTERHRIHTYTGTHTRTPYTIYLHLTQSSALDRCTHNTERQAERERRRQTDRE